VINLNCLERRLFFIGGALVCLGGILAALIYGVYYGFSFLAGGVLSALNLLWLRHTVNSAFVNPDKSKSLMVVGFILRLMLIPLCLYAIIRLFYFGIIAAIAGFAVFSGCILVEGLLEAFKQGSK
jgi:hypothetical protein